MYLQVTRGNAWYKIQKSETENVFFKRQEMYNFFFGREVLTLLYISHLLIIMCNYLTLLRPKQTFRPGHPARDYSNIYRKLKSKIKTLIEVKQTCPCVPLTPSSPTDLTWTSYTATPGLGPPPPPCRWWGVTGTENLALCVVSADLISPK